MLTKAELYNKLIFIAKEKFVHAHYSRVTALADKYLALLTGEGADKLLKQFNVREDKKLFDQRVRITQIITPCVINSFMIPQRKVPQVKPVIKEAGYTSTETSNKKKTDLWSSINNHYAGNDIDYYLKEKPLSIANHDPNAFVVTSFKSFDPLKEKPKAFSYEVSCKSAVDFEYENGILTYLVERYEIKYPAFVKDSFNKKKSKPKADKQGLEYLIHGSDDNIKLIQVDVTMASNAEKERLFILNVESGVIEYIDVADAQKDVTYFIKLTDSVLFQVNFYDPKSKGVPAFRVGYLLDPYTDYQTCINHWHAALPRLMKTVKSVSELDLSVSLHVFPKMLAYVDKCPGEPNVGCDKGETTEGEKCALCHGSGEKLIRSSQDAVLYPRPRNPEEMFDLSKMIHYVTLPTDIIDWMDKYIDKTCVAAYQDIYNSDVYAKNTVVSTATEVTIKSQSVIDALMPLFAWYSMAWKFIVNKIAIYRSIDANLLVEHQFPKRPSFDSIQDLFDLMKAAKDAGAPQSVLNEYADQVVDQQLADRPHTIKRYKTEQAFDPFIGKSPDLISLLLSSSDALQEHKVLWINLKPILQEAERLYIAATSSTKDTEFVNFYDLSYDEQKAYVDKVLNIYMEKFKAQQEQATKVNIPFDFNTPALN